MAGFGFLFKKILSKNPKIRPRENAITFSSEGVLTQMRVLINSTQLDLQNKTDFRQKYFLSKKLRSIEYQIPRVPPLWVPPLFCSSGRRRRPENFGSVFC